MATVLNVKETMNTPDDRAYQMYLEDISHIPTLDEEKTRELALKAQAGNQIAVDRLTTANLKLVISLAKLYANQGVPLVDLINEGNIGLIEAVRRYDVNGGKTFSTFAREYIIKHIKSQLTEPEGVVYRPRVQKVEESSKITAPKALRKKSFDAPVSSSNRATLLDKMQNRNSVDSDDSALSATMRDMLKGQFFLLNEREQKVISMSFGIDESPITFQEIAEALDISRSRVRQVRKTALRKLRQGNRRG